MLQFFPFGLAATAAQSNVTLAWDASSATDMAGYRLYYGETSHNYSQMLDVGNMASASISGLIVGATYYFAVTAYSREGLESAPSTEISYVVTAASASPPPPVLANVSSGQPGVLSGTAPVGFQYEVMATTDLQKWRVIGVVSVDASGSFHFADPEAPNIPAKYYRLRQTAP